MTETTNKLLDLLPQSREEWNRYDGETATDGGMIYFRRRESNDRFVLSRFHVLRSYKIFRMKDIFLY